MKLTLKKTLSLLLCALTILGCLTACGGNNETPDETTATPAPTESPEEAKVLKVLTLGHSLSLDAGHMLTLVANAEGYKDMTLGTLYYPGCSLAEHVDFMESNAPEYKLFISSTTTADALPKQMDNVSIKDAVRFDKWDIVILQGGVFEVARDSGYTNGNIQILQKFVEENKLNTSVRFVWNMIWAPATDDELRSTYPKDPNPYFTTYKEWNEDRLELYKDVTRCVSQYIMTDETFVDMIPSSTVYENALTSYLEEKDMHRDYAHATDFARLMVSYLWYCRLTGVDKLEEVKLDTVPKKFFKSRVQVADWELTEDEKALILESVNNALANPLQMTQSQYTVAPAN